MQWKYFLYIKHKKHVQITSRHELWQCHHFVSITYSLCLRCTFINPVDVTQLCVSQRSRRTAHQDNAPTSTTAGSLLKRCTSVGTGAGYELARPITRDPPMAGISQRKKDGSPFSYAEKCFKRPPCFWTCWQYIQRHLTHSSEITWCYFFLRNFGRF